MKMMFNKCRNSLRQLKSECANYKIILLSHLLKETDVEEPLDLAEVSLRLHLVAPLLHYIPRVPDCLLPVMHLLSEYFVNLEENMGVFSRK